MTLTSGYFLKKDDLGLRVDDVYSIFFIIQGVPLRIEVGLRDVKAEQAIVVRRDTGDKVSVR